MHSRDINLGLHDSNTACSFCAYGGCNSPQVICQAIADLHSTCILLRSMSLSHRYLKVEILPHLQDVLVSEQGLKFLAHLSNWQSEHVLATEHGV